MSGDDPKLFVVFSSASYDQTALLDGVAGVAGKVPVIGCTTAGEIVAAGPSTAGVVIMALGGKGFVVMAGDIASVQAAVTAGCKAAAEDGMLVGKGVIPNPSPELFKEYI